MTTKFTIWRYFWLLLLAALVACQNLEASEVSTSMPTVTPVYLETAN